jgi:hypothetical protein
LRWNQSIQPANVTSSFTADIAMVFSVSDDMQLGGCGSKPKGCSRSTASQIVMTIINNKNTINQNIYSLWLDRFTGYVQSLNSQKPKCFAISCITSTFSTFLNQISLVHLYAAKWSRPAIFTFQTFAIKANVYLIGLNISSVDVLF